MSSQIRPPHTAIRDGFTLIELLVVMSIILLLIGILVPVISKIRIAARVADCKAQLNTLMTGIENYQLAFRAYPGPVSNAELYAGKTFTGSGTNSITASENMLLGLLGGLQNVSGTIDYSANILTSQQGPFVLNPAAPRGAAKNYANLQAGELSNSAGDGSGNLTGSDSNIPEVIDRFSSDIPNPVIYLRASNGRAGAMSDAATSGGPYQYDVRQVSVYTSNLTNASKNGLKVLGTFGTMATASAPSAPQVGYHALPYFVDQVNPGTNNATGNPRAKDSFMLVGAGADGIFGTADDICSFGAVVP